MELVRRLFKKRVFGLLGGYTPPNKQQRRKFMCLSHTGIASGIVIHFSKPTLKNQQIAWELQVRCLYLHPHLHLYLYLYLYLYRFISVSISTCISMFVSISISTFVSASISDIYIYTFTSISISVSISMFIPVSVLSIQALRWIHFLDPPSAPFGWSSSSD